MKKKSNQPFWNWNGEKNGEEMYSVYFWIYSLESYTASEIWHYNLVCSSHDTKIQ